MLAGEGPKPGVGLKGAQFFHLLFGVGDLDEFVVVAQNEMEVAVFQFFCGFFEGIQWKTASPENELIGSNIAFHDPPLRRL